MIFSNLAGTMSDSFAIGKRGVKLLQGTEAPTSSLVAPIGSLYLLKSGVSIKVYQLVAAETWEPLLTAGAIPFLVARSDDNVPNALTLSTSGSLDFSPTTGVIKIANNPQFQGWGGFVPPKGSSLQRPSSPIEGQVRFNTDEGKLELYSNSAWNFLAVTDLAGRPAASGETYRQTFTSADVLQGKVIVNHGLAEKYVTVTVYDNEDYMVMPDRLRLVDSVSVEIDVSTHTITGTWNIVITQ